MVHIDGGTLLNRKKNEFESVVVRFFYILLNLFNSVKVIIYFHFIGDRKTHQDIKLCIIS